MGLYEKYADKFGSPYYKGKHMMTLGEKLKHDSDMIMEETWDNDLQSKVAYIYDYYHDDQPDLNIGMTYENTSKTPVDIKFILNEYGSMSKDQPTVKIQFKPSMKVFFDESDELYYIEERRRKLGMQTPFVGLYLDLPDSNGIYRRWMIIVEDVYGNQFNKYFVLPCNYRMEWIRKEGNKRIKQRMWCVLRSQSSYNNGLWTD